MKAFSLPAVVLSAVLLAGATLRAQLEEPPAQGQIGLTLSSRGTATGDAKLKGGDTTFEQVKIGEYQLAIDKMFFVNGDMLKAGLDYEATSINQHNTTVAQVPLPDKLQSLAASISYTKKINQRWIFSSRVGVGSHVADTGLLSDGWGVTAFGLGIYNQSPTLTLVFGAAYNSISQDLRIVPILGLNWRPAPHWSLGIGFPKTEIAYHFDRTLSVGLAVSGSGGTYHIKDDPLPGIAPSSLANSKLEQREIRLGFDADWKINQTFALSGTIGHVLYRKFRYVDRGYDLKSRDIVPFLSLGIRARL